MSIGKVHYQVRPVTRHLVTRYVEDGEGRPGGSDVKGEFDNANLAYEIGYALAKDEHGRLGWPIGDDRMQYPKAADADDFPHSAASSRAWMETAAQHSRNEDFYRNLVCEIGELFGDAAFLSDDGSLQDSVLALKVPGLVRKALADRRRPFP